MSTGQNSVVTVQSVCAISVGLSGTTTVTDSARNCTAANQAAGVCRITIGQGGQAIESDKLYAAITIKTAGLILSDVLPVAGSGETQYDIHTKTDAGVDTNADMSIVLGQWV